MKRQMEGEHLSKEEYADQSFNFAGNGPEQPSVMASEQTMRQRTIKPLKKPKWVGRGGGSGSGGSSLPNVFAGAAQVTFGGGNANGGASPAPAQTGFGFGGGSATSSGATTPNAPQTFGNGFSGFGQSQQQGQTNSNPFGSLAPSPASQNNGTFNFSASASTPAPTPASNGNIFGSNGTNTGGNTAPTPSFGNSFGTNNTTQAPTTSSFQFNSPATSNNMFGGTSSNPPSSATFNFGGTSSSDTSKPFTFGQNTASKPEAPAASSAPNFFGAAAASAPSPGTGFGFGNNAAAPQKTDETPKLFPGFGNPSASTADKPRDDAPKFGGFGASSPSAGSSLFGKTPEQSSAGSSLFGRPSPSPEPSVGASLFGKPSPSPEPPASNMFTPKPVDKPAQSSSVFGAPKADEPKSPFAGFGAGPQKSESPKPLFGNAPTEKEPAKPLFGSTPDANKNAQPTSLFGAPAMNENKVAQSQPMFEPSKPLFGDGFKASPDSTKGPFGNSTTSEKKEDPPKSVFGSASSSAQSSSNIFGQPSSSTSSPFGKPTETKTPEISFTPAEPASNALSYPALPAPKPSSPANILRGVSPPLPSGASNWPSAQLNEFYNVFALRSLNHAFKEQLSLMDVFADFSEVCQMYQDEATKIKNHMETNTRYRFEDGTAGTLGPGAPGKRAGEDNNEGGGKRRNLGEDSSRSSSSQALASIIGSNSSPSGSGDHPQLATKPAFGFTPPAANAKTSNDGPKLAAKPSFGFVPPTANAKPTSDGPKLAAKPAFGFVPPRPAGSIFDKPTEKSKSSWDNPFKPVDPSSLPDDPEPIVEEEDEEEDKPSGNKQSKSSGGSLFDRISSPATPSKPPGTSLFGTPGADNTWSPEKGVKFSTTKEFNIDAKAAPTAPTSSLFGSGTASSSPFNTPADVGFSFGSSVTKPSSSLAPPTTASDATTPATTVSDASEGEGEPSDAAPPPVTNTALSEKGPGEEDEDSLFESRAILYDMSCTPPQKRGVAALRVLKNRETGKGRMLMRTDNGNIILNVEIRKAVKYELQSKNTMTFPEFLVDGTRKTWCVRVKPEPAQKMVKAVNDAKG